ncbi:hypothetical protein [Oryzibacter oryziterrae]|uniref:hypothetical protein n=1 Tax=Oryzibacter oryziterrae TaxID=2766474 RepID=UPI001F15B072|nr:hypothetical protein [Oryzibacter oryziterrae]
MPSLMRFLRTVLLGALVIAGVLLALAYLVQPRTRPMTEPVDNAPLHAPAAGPVNTPQEAR